MEILESQRQFNRNRIINIIDKAKDKIEKQESIKNELFILREICNYLKQMHKDSIETIALLDEVIPEFANYQNQYEETRRKKKLQRLKIEKESEYKQAWWDKSLIYKIFHRKMNPKKIDFIQMTHETIKENIEKLTSKQK